MTPHGVRSDSASRGPSAPARPLRVGMVCPYSLSIPGGVQAQVLGLARELRRQGHEVRVLGPCDGPPPEPFVTPLGDSLPASANGSVAPLAPDPSATLRTIRVLRDEAFDVVHIHEPLAPGPPITSVVLHTAPTVGTFHAAGRSSSYRFMAGGLRRILGRLDHKVVVSKDALALVQGYLGGEFEMLFNGVETTEIRSVEPARPERRSIFFVGRHEERKGLGVLLAALRLTDADITCWVAGDGPDSAALRSEYAADTRIEWLGRISDADKIARLRGASLFCAPSLHGESFGVVLIEAMAAGTPVVASSLDGYRNVATHGVDSLLVPPGDPEALARAIEQVLADDDLAARLVANGEHRAEDFAMSSLAAAYVGIYERLRAGGVD
ncbi:MAG: glycosyltransferase family 4 protein [Ilumatobacteraceae bacterium]|nr:glycosyltransferase family 4 protein [Ilumatobacteraceae bacterium]